jgi:hypothetical protein
MPRPRHPNKEIEAAVRYAEGLGWTCTLSTGHAWGRLRCAHGQRGGCQFSVWSTPRNAHNHAAQIRRRVDKCPHHSEEEEDDAQEEEAD